MLEREAGRENDSGDADRASFDPVRVIRD